MTSTAASEAVSAILSSLRLSEKLKLELRHSWLSNGRQESVAEHTWQMTFLACLVHPYLQSPVDLAHALKLIIVHDLAEAEVGDIPFFETSDRKSRKRQLESEAMERIKGVLPTNVSKEFCDLWNEFEEGATPESKFARAIDHLEVQIQHNFADLDTWQPIEHELVFTKMDMPCSHDDFLRLLCEAVKAQSIVKLRDGGVDPEEVKSRAFAK